MPFFKFIAEAQEKSAQTGTNVVRVSGTKSKNRLEECQRHVFLKMRVLSSVHE